MNHALDILFLHGHCEFIPEGATVNGQYYLGVMQHVFTHMRRVRKDLFQKSSWLLLHDNALAHYALPVTQ
jgi:hypothetical protein